MTDFMQYEKGCSPCAIQRKYSLTYAQGYELAERLKKTQELRRENAQLKELLKECFEYIDWTDGTGSPFSQQKLLNKIDEALK